MKSLPHGARHVLDAAADAAGIDRELVRAVAWVESRGNSRAVSHAGALGLMQIMPATAKGLGLLSDEQVADVQKAMAEGGPEAVKELQLPAFDPAKNALAGARMLARLIERSADLSEALARYNWGTGNVTRRGGWPDSVQRRYIDPVLARMRLEREEQDTPVTRAPSTAQQPAPKPAKPQGARTAAAPFTLCSPSLRCPQCGSALALELEGALR